MIIASAGRREICADDQIS